MERARERGVLAEERLVVPPLGVLEQLRAPVAAKRAGEDHASDGVLQRPAPYRMSPTTGSRQDGQVPWMRTRQASHTACPFLHWPTTNATRNEQSDSPLQRQVHAV